MSFFFTFIASKYMYIGDNVNVNKPCVLNHRCNKRDRSNKQRARV